MVLVQAVPVALATGLVVAAVEVLALLAALAVKAATALSLLVISKHFDLPLLTVNMTCALVHFFLSDHS